MQSGRVLAVDFAGALPSAEVEVADAPSCPRCAAGKGCGAGLLGSARASRRVRARISHGLAVHSGDAVRMELLPRRLLHAALIVYGLPLAGGVIAAGLAFLAGLGDLAATVAGLAGLAVGMLAGRRRAARRHCEFTPVIVEVVERAD